MRRFLSYSFTILLASIALWLLLFGKRPTEFHLPSPTGVPGNSEGPTVRRRTILTFWEKWSGQEATAMQAIVDRYNLSQADVFINLVSMSQINQKMLIATAGGDPPDICGLWADQVAPYIANHAIEPLDELQADGSITQRTYKPYVWRTCAPDTAGGHIYAVSATPETCALFWNKDLFAKAGLDPEKPPVSMEELWTISDRLTLRNGDTLEQTGFLPNEPGWWDYAWGIYWGNNLYDAQSHHFNIDTPEQRTAYAWYQSYFLKYGPGETQSFTSGFGQFNSPQNAFISGKVAMVVQGPFFANFIRMNRPTLVGHYGVTFVPLPECLHQPPNSVAFGDLDVWVIPRGCKHKTQALAALRFFSLRDNMESLCRAHNKSSPLMDVSKDFITTNPNPFIEVFEQTMLSPHVYSKPDSPVWERAQSEINTAIGNMRLDPAKYPVAPTLAKVQATVDGYVAEYQHYADMRAKLETQKSETRP